MPIKRSLHVCFALTVVSSGWIAAAPLNEAHVTKIINEVKLTDPTAGDRKARLNDVVRGDIALTTGIKSRSELVFQDNTLTRLGPESYFSFKSGTRDMTLQQGTLLLQVPKGLGGAKIHTASVTAAITGTTIMMEYVPNKDIKVLVLEGTLRLSINGRFGDSLLLQPGGMVIMAPNAKRIPDPVTIDLKKVVQTSKLVNMSSGHTAHADQPSLPSISLVEKEIERQQNGKDAHNLIDTNLVILGKGTNVLLGSDNLMAELAVRNDLAKIAAGLAASPSLPAPVATPVPTPNPTPNPLPTPNPNPPPSGTPTPPPPVGYVIDGTTSVNTQNSSATITTGGVSTVGVIYKDLQTNGSPSAFLFGASSNFDNEFGFDNSFLPQFQQSAVFTFDSLQLGGGITFVTHDGTNNVVLVGDDGITNSAGSAVNLSGANNILFATQAGNITLDSGISFTTSSGDKPNVVQFYARGGDLNIGSTFTLPNTDLKFAAENNALFDSGSTISAKSLTVTGLQTVQFDGNATLGNEGLFQLNGGDVEMGGTITAKIGYVYGSSASINGTFTGQDLTANVTGDFNLNGSVSLAGDAKFQITAGNTATINGTIFGNVTINAQNIDFGTDVAIGNNFKGELTATGNIDATGHALSGFDAISATGNFTAGSATANTFAVGGTLAGGSINAINAGTIVANALHADNVTANHSITVNSADLGPYATNTISINAPNISLASGAVLDGVNGTPLIAPGNASNLTIVTNNDFTIGANFSLTGGDGDTGVSDGGGNGGQLSVTANSITVNAPISATTGQDSNNSMTGGNGGTVNLTSQNVTVNNSITVSSDDGNRRRSASGGSINITNSQSGGATITINSSAQLLALLNAAAPGPGGSIKVILANGNINMNGTAQADRGPLK